MIGCWDLCPYDQDSISYSVIPGHTLRFGWVRLLYEYVDMEVGPWSLLTSSYVPSHQYGTWLTFRIGPTWARPLQRNVRLRPIISTIAKQMSQAENEKVIWTSACISIGWPLCRYLRHHWEVQARCIHMCREAECSLPAARLRGWSSHQLVQAHMVRERIVNDETLTIYEGGFIYCDVSELTVNIYV